jgi:thiol reductant ABC exporter CydC subunit
MIAEVRRLDALAAPGRGRLARTIFLGALAAVLGVGLMATAGYLISRAAERPPILSLTVAIVAVRFFGLTRPLARYAERLSSHDLALRALGRFRSRVYERLEPLAPLQWSGDRRGDLVSRVVSDVDALQGLYLRQLLPPFVALLAAAACVGVVAGFVPAAAVVLACGLALAGVVVPAAGAALVRRPADREAQARGELTAELVELLAGAPELVVCNREDDRLRRIADADAKLVRIARRAALAGGLTGGLHILVVGATLAGVLAAAVAAHANGGLDRVLIAMLALLALASFEVVQPLAAAALELPETLASGARVLELVDRAPAVDDPPSPAALPSGPLAIALEGVRVRYAAGEAPALDGVSLRLEPGQKLALVGPSGAGKTTVANLLLRFVDPEAGRITLGGKDLRSYRLEDVRRAIALAGQDSYLFSATIRANVLIGRPEATNRELEDALAAAGILDWTIGLAAGWDTKVGEEGRAVSGGQRQRIAIARALITRAPILVLDEPTAHLDRPTATRLLHDVLTATPDRSVLLITHRPEGLDLVDAVHVLQPCVDSAQSRPKPTR